MTAEVRRDFLSDVKWLGLVQVAMRAKGLIVVPFLTRDLGVIHFGIWTQLLIITAVLTPLISWGTAYGFIRRMPGVALAERLRFYHAWIYALLAAAAVVFIAVMAASVPLSKSLLNAAPDGTALIALTVTFALIGGLLNAEVNWLRVNGESRVHALALLSQATLSLAAVVVFLLIGGSVLLLFALTVLADALIVLALLLRHLARYGWGPPDFAAYWKSFRYGLPLMPTAFADIAIIWVDRIVLLRFLPFSEVGVYNLVHGIAVMLVQSMTQPFRAYYPPRATAYFNEGKMRELRALYGLSAGTLFAIQLPSAVGLFFVAPAFLAIMAPPEFAAGVQVLPLLFLGFAIDRQSTYTQQVLEWKYRQHWITISLLGCLALNLLFNFLLVPRIGILGAGYSNVAAFALRYVFMVALARRDSPIRANAGFVMKIIAASTVMGTALWVVRGALDETGAWNALVTTGVMLAAGGIVYGMALVGLGIVPGGRALAYVRRALPQ